MKKLRVLFASLAVATLLVGAFAFIPKKTDVVTYYFTAPHKHIGSGTNQLVQSEVQDPSNWTLTNPGYTFSNDVFMAAIVFDQDALSKQNAIEGVWSSYSTSLTLPADNQNIQVSSNDVTIRRKDSN